ncbi:hypothetical protein BDW74DRAFT_172175 [Aspergillus multicolor]|uniref:uncharacterized protein n=1 Tax=Aspergillus multicolor TaxID=41759 RepID=UPI003CCCABB1
MIFRGWGLLTDTYTHCIFWNGVRGENRHSLPANVVQFILDNDLDGGDFDWEYPGVAHGIPDINQDNLNSGESHSEFLKSVRDQLPEDKSILMALPSSAAVAVRLWLTPDSYNSQLEWYDCLNFGDSVACVVDPNRTCGSNDTSSLQESEDDWPDYEPCPYIIFKL